MWTMLPSIIYAKKLKLHHCVEKLETLSPFQTSAFDDASTHHYYFLSAYVFVSKALRYGIS